MGSETDNSLQMRAIEWHVRLRHADEATWDAFADWLAQDPRHLPAYEAIEQTDLAIEPLLPRVRFSENAPDSQSSAAGLVMSAARRWWLVGSALAAAILAGVVLLPQPTSSRYEIATGAGQHQVVALDAATRITLNGSTRMSFDRSNPRFAALSSGEALFQVRHDDAQPFTLEIGNNRIKDVGTVFNVVRDSGEVRVAVAEGKVIYSSPAKAIALGAGEALFARSDSGVVRVSAALPASVGAWQRGRLVYSGEPLSQVAADLGRSLGVHIVVSPTLEAQPFSGAIVFNGTGPEQLERLKLALNVDLVAGPTGWTMKPLHAGER